MTKTPRIPLGAALRRERERRHWTQEELAERIQGSVPSVNRWENGRASPQPEMLQKLIALFGKPMDAWGAARTRIWTIPYLRNLYFTGRERILARLHTVLSEQNIVAVSQTRAISGLGGIGKTQTALEYAYRYADEYDAVLWVRADAREALVAQFAGLAPLFGLPNHAEADQHRLAKAAKRWLETQEEQVWLLIFDNVEDISLVKEFLPTRGNGAILLTTRLHAVGTHIRKIDLETLTLEEGVQFLQARLGAEGARGGTAFSEAERQAAEQLCALLDGLPLALDHAAAYMEERQCSLAEYVSLYQQQRATFLQLRNQIDAEDYPDSVATTWLLSFQRVEQASPVAADLLHTLAFLHPDAIPAALLLQGAATLGTPLQAVVENPALLQQAIDLLQRYSLIRHNPKTDMLSIHRLVQAVIHDGLEAARARQWAESAVRLVSRAFPETVFANWDRCEQFLPHALVCVSHIKAWQFVFPEAAHLLNRAGEYLCQRARYGETLPLFQQALMMREQVLPPTHPDLAESLNNLAFLYHEQGRYAETLPLYQRALAIWEQALGPVHRNVAESLNNLAESYRLLGYYAEALPLYQRALAIDEQIYDPTHPEVATDLNNLALLEQAQGRYGEARRHYQRALDIWEQAYGPKHPLVARSLNNLAGLARVQGQYAEMLPLVQRALSIGEQVLGPDHPYVAQSLHHLGGFYRGQGQYAEALPRFERALAIREQALGPTHPLVAQGLTSLAELYQVQGQYAKAEPLFRRALAIREQALGPTHPEVAQSLNALATLSYEHGDYAEAEPLFQRALHIRQQTWGAEHPDTAETMDDLGQLWKAQDHREEARSWYTRALAARERTLGTHHSKTAETRQRLIALLHAMGRHEEAARFEAAPPGQGPEKET